MTSARFGTLRAVCIAAVGTCLLAHGAEGLIEMPSALEGQSFRVREVALGVAQLTGYDRRVAPENASVQVSINFDAIQDIDLKEGTMTMIAWFRLSWKDPSLAWNDTQWGMGRSFRAGKEIWTPDVVFYNGLNVEAGLSEMSAQVSPDGGAFWSRPGKVIILCNFKGLENFPNDELSCGIDIAAWFLDGIEQDIIPWESDGGYDFPGKGGAEVAPSFADYSFKDISLTRVETFYTCCPGRPYPMLKYKMTFTRATNFYFSKLVVPQIAAIAVSWLTFWMHPEVGERIGFGITLILTVVAFDWVASEHTPICNQPLMLNVMSQSVSIMIIFSVVESVIVLYIYYWKAWTPEHYIPYPIWLIWSRLGAGKHRETDLSKKIKLLGNVPETDQKETEVPTQTKTSSASQEGASADSATGASDFAERAERIRLYRRAFFMLDADYSARLDADEVNHFGGFMLGKQGWNEDLLTKFMNGKQFVNLSEFCEACDKFMRSQHASDDQKLGALVEAFTQSLERADASEYAVSKRIANQIDQYCRWLVPPIEIIILAIIMGRDFTPSE